MRYKASVSHLSERNQQILRTLVELHIRNGQPVSSRAIARTSGLGLSPATVRNAMYELEEEGYIASPHTSAGRVPTQRGYRAFVDELLRVPPGDQVSAAELRRQLASARGGDSKDLVESVSSVLSGFTHMTGVVTLPRREVSTLRYVEFLPLEQRRVLVILVVNDHEVQNRVISTERDYSRAELERTTNYLNEQFAGRDLADIRRELRRELEATRSDVSRMMDIVADTAGQAFGEAADGGEGTSDFVLAGETNLMNFEELSDIDKLKGLFDTFNRKRDLFELLERSVQSDGLQIFIGRESGHEVLDDLSIVTAPYSYDGEVLGVLGVIGPTRMEYERVISVVDVTSRLLGAELGERG